MAYLASKLLVHLDIAIGAVESLLEESKQDRDDDDGLESLSEDDEEDGNRKDVDGHDDGFFSEDYRVKMRGESSSEGRRVRKDDKKRATRCGNGLHRVLFGCEGLKLAARGSGELDLIKDHGL